MFLEIFNELVKFIKLSIILVIRKSMRSARLSAHGQTNVALFFVFFLTFILQSWPNAVSFLLPIFQINH